MKTNLHHRGRAHNVSGNYERVKIARKRAREKKWKIALRPTFSFFPTKEAGPRLTKRQNKNIFRFALSKYAQMVISKTCKMMSLLIVNQKRTEWKTWRDSLCSMRAYSHHIWPLDVINFNFVTLFDLAQNTNNDKTRQSHKSK